MTDNTSGTMQFQLPRDRRAANEIINSIQPMKEKGYDPVNQIVGYLLSGDPTYITSYNNARYLIRRLDRDELVEELVRYYVEGNASAE
jgi:uncharacterized protein (UPF0297 family)